MLSLSQTLTRDLSSSRAESLLGCKEASRGHLSRRPEPRPPSFADEMTADSWKRTEESHTPSHSHHSIPTSTNAHSSQHRLCTEHNEIITELQADLLQKSHEIERLRSALNIAACQRSDLLKESELLRHTVSELKSLHRREIAELKAQLASECAHRAAADRQLAESYVAERPVELRTQVERLASKLQALEDRHREQETASEGMKERVVRLAAQRSKMKENYSPQLTERSSKSPHVHRRG